MSSNKAFVSAEASIATRQWAQDFANSWTSDSGAHSLIANALSNSIASVAGAAAGVASGGGNSSLNVLNGAAAASAIQQFNQAEEENKDESVRGPKTVREAFDWLLGSSAREVAEENRTQNDYDAACELKELDPSNPALSALIDPKQQWVPSQNDIAEMYQALSEAQEVNRLLTTSVGQKELLEKSSIGTENLREPAQEIVENEKNNNKQYPDGSFRTPDGKFSNQTGSPAPGTKAAEEFTQFLRNKGFDVVGEELTVKALVGNRRYDAVVRAPTGDLWGIEYKSGGTGKTRQQEFNDMFVNRFGANGVGALAGTRVVGAITVKLP